jgi:hypothetical protein
MLAPMISRHFPFPAPSPAPLRETPHHCARPLTPDDVKIVKNASKIIEDLKIVISEASSTILYTARPSHAWDGCEGWSRPRHTPPRKDWLSTYQCGETMDGIRLEGPRDVYFLVLRIY